MRKHLMALLLAAAVASTFQTARSAEARVDWDALAGSISALRKAHEEKLSSAHFAEWSAPETQLLLDELDRKVKSPWALPLLDYLKLRMRIPLMKEGEDTLPPPLQQVGSGLYIMEYIGNWKHRVVTRNNNRFFDTISFLLCPGRFTSNRLQCEGTIQKTFRPGRGPIVPPQIPESMSSMQGMPGFSIGKSFAEAGLFDRAWRAQIEYIYGVKESEILNSKSNGSWLAPEVAWEWAMTGEYAYQSGHFDMALECIVKSGVFGLETDYDSALKTLKKWQHAEESGMKPSFATNDLKTRKESMAMIVRFYEGMNFHPRLFELLRDHPDLFADSKAEKERLLSSWKTMIQNYVTIYKAEKLVIFGTEVYPHGDPLKVTIPWAFSDEAMKEVRKLITKRQAAVTAR